jgi:hypothetical protein
MHYSSRWASYHIPDGPSKAEIVIIHDECSKLFEQYQKILIEEFGGKENIPLHFKCNGDKYILKSTDELKKIIKVFKYLSEFEDDEDNIFSLSLNDDFSIHLIPLEQIYPQVSQEFISHTIDKLQDLLKFMKENDIYEGKNIAKEYNEQIKLKGFYTNPNANKMTPGPIEKVKIEPTESFDDTMLTLDPNKKNTK